MNYKRILLLFLGLISLHINAQSSAPSVNFKFKMPKTEGAVDDSHYNTLRKKVMSLHNGGQAFSNQSPFSIIPSIEVVNEMEHGEATTVKVVKVKVSISAVDTEHNVVFSEFEKVIPGSGKTTKAAISSAINALKTSDPKLKSFFTDAYNDIIAYYRNNCDKILRSARVNIQRKEFNRAYDFLKYVPDDIACFAEVESLITKIYFENKDETCKKLVHLANIEEAKENYTKALSYLRYVDTGANCYASASQLINKIGTKINSDSMKDFEMEKLKFEKLTDLEKMRILSTNADLLTVTVVDK